MLRALTLGLDFCPIDKSTNPGDPHSQAALLVGLHISRCQAPANDLSLKAGEEVRLWSDPLRSNLTARKQMLGNDPGRRLRGA